MNDTFKTYEESLHTVYIFSLPQYKDTIHTDLSMDAFMVTAKKALKDLDWTLISESDNTLIAEREEIDLGFRIPTERITIKYSFGVIEIKSKSLSKIISLGRNWKRVKLFIFAYEETRLKMTEEDLRQIDDETIEKWSSYTVPSQLTPPTLPKPYSYHLLIILGLALSLIIGFVSALNTKTDFFILFMLDYLFLYIIEFTIGYGMKRLYYIGIAEANFIILCILLLGCFFHQFFYYELILEQNEVSPIGFWSFLKLGGAITSMSYGWLLLLLVSAFQIFMMFLIITLRLYSLIILFIQKTIPKDVSDFCTYLFIKGKTDEEVRLELAAKGWSDVIYQDNAFSAMRNNIWPVNR